jgi:xanthine dehydrogenase small subunit
MESVRSDFCFTLNGAPVRVERTDPQTTLLDFVRARGLTGAKEGCAEGECGACAVIFLRNSIAGTVYTAVNSCLVPLPAAADHEVLTVEALAASGELAAVQRAMASAGGSQCGYCTPGFVVSMFAEHYRRDWGKAGPADPHVLGGNLCRCTGYRPIRDALLSLGEAPQGTHKERLERPAPQPRAYAYASPAGRFSRPRDLAECFDLLDLGPEARLVAGNTDLGVATNLHGRRFPHLVSVENLAELRQFSAGPDAVEIGAGLTLTEIAERWSDAPGIFHEWIALFASPLIRNRATLGGNLATASPIGDSAPLLLALDASLCIARQASERWVPLESFFMDYRKTVLGAGEVIKSVRIPRPWPDYARFYKIAKRSMDDISTVAAGMAIWTVRGRVASARFAYGGVASVPVRARAAETALTGTRGSLEDFERARKMVKHNLSPLSDHRGSARYRSAVAESLLDKFAAEVRQLGVRESKAGQL